MNLRLKDALKIRNMKQTDLAKRSGISSPSISCYLSGKYEPKQAAIYQMSKVLNVNEMWLMGYDVAMERTEEQIQNDEIIDIINRLKIEKEFKKLIIKINDLNSNQLDVIKNLIAAFNN